MCPALQPPFPGTQLSCLCVGGLGLGLGHLALLHRRAVGGDRRATDTPELGLAQSGCRVAVAGHSDWACCVTGHVPHRVPGLQQGRGLQQGPRLRVRSGAPLPGLQACDPSGQGGRWRLPRSSLPPADCSSTREYWLAFGQESKGKGREGNEKQTWRGILFIYSSLLLFLAVLHNFRDPKFPN